MHAATSGLRWSNPKTILFSAERDPDLVNVGFASGYSFFRDTMSYSNETGLFQCTMWSHTGGIPASDTRKHAARYLYVLSDWTASDEFCIDLDP